MQNFEVRCPSCGALNRVPADKEGIAGKCGSCRGELPPLYSHPLQLDDSSFNAFVSSYPGPVLVEFWAPW